MQCCLLVDSVGLRSRLGGGWSDFDVYGLLLRACRGNIRWVNDYSANASVFGALSSIVGPNVMNHALSTPLNKL